MQIIEITGAGIAVVNSDSSPALIRKLKVKTIPEVVALVKGRLVHYSGGFAVKELREFVRSLLSSNSVTMVGDERILIAINFILVLLLLLLLSSSLLLLLLLLLY